MSPTEKDFKAVAFAAHKLFEEGYRETAYILDDLAKKIHAELTTRSTLNTAARGLGMQRVKVKVESPLEVLGLRLKAKRAS